jgi:hypothetical protein
LAGKTATFEVEKKKASTSAHSQTNLLPLATIASENFTSQLLATVCPCLTGQARAFQVCTKKIVMLLVTTVLMLVKSYQTFCLAIKLLATRILISVILVLAILFLCHLNSPIDNRTTSGTVQHLDECKQKSNSIATLLCGTHCLSCLPPSFNQILSASAEEKPAEHRQRL